MVEEACTREEITVAEAIEGEVWAEVGVVEEEGEAVERRRSRMPRWADYAHDPNHRSDAQLSQGGLDCQDSAAPGASDV